MSLKKLFIIFTFVPLGVQAQSVSASYAPISMDLWGETKFTSVYSVEYDMFGLHYFNIHERSVDELGAVTVDNAVAISVRPVNIEDIFKLGVIVFNKTFPTENGRRTNLWIEAGVDIKMFRLSYVHISNAYTGRLNHGIDFINLSVSF